MKSLRAIGRAVRDGWLIVGMTLLVFLGLEAGYRAYRTLQKPPPRTRSVDSTQHPYAKQEWWQRFQGPEGLASRKNRYDPYRSHWAGPTSSTFVNVDSAGRRLTVQAHRGNRKVFMLGGSTMWGYTARDSFTIPSLTAAALASRGIEDIEVVNLAQAAYNSTQELNTVVLELLAGQRPAAAVFLDGYNDIGTGWVHGVPGRTYGEESIEGRIELGARGFWSELVGLGRHAALVKRLRRAAGGPPRRDPTSAGPEVCGPVARYYTNVVAMTEALGGTYGFHVAYFLQPIHVMSRKKLTPWEDALPRQRALGPCVASIDSAMADRQSAVYHSLSGIFDDDTATVFIDQNAHLTEAANRVVAERIADVLAPLLRRPADSAP